MDGRILGFDAQTLFSAGLVLLNVLLLCFVVYKLMYHPVQKFLQDRAERVAKQQADAAQNLQETDALKASYEQKIREIEAERNQILEVARRKALDKETQILQAAKAEAEQIKKRAFNDIALEQEKVRDEMKQQMVEMAVLLAGRFVEKTIDEKTQNELFNAALSELRETKWLA